MSRRGVNRGAPAPILQAGRGRTDRKVMTCGSGHPRERLAPAGALGRRRERGGLAAHYAGLVFSACDTAAAGRVREGARRPPSRVGRPTPEMTRTHGHDEDRARSSRQSRRPGLPVHARPGAPRRGRRYRGAAFTSGGAGRPSRRVTAMAAQYRTRASSHRDWHHFCGNCPDWPPREDSVEIETPELHRVCPACLRLQLDGRCEPEMPDLVGSHG